MSKKLVIIGIKNCWECPAYYSYDDDYSNRYHECNMKADIGDEYTFNGNIVSPNCPLPDEA